MVGPDPSEPQIETGPQIDSARGAYVRSLLALAAVAATIGAFFASLAMTHQAALESGVTVPSVSWLRSGRDWLPLWCIGFGLARLAGVHRAGHTALRGFAIGVVFALAAFQAITGGGVTWLPSAVALLLGLVLGLHCDSARLTAWAGVVVAGLAAAATAFAVLAMPPVWGLGPSHAAGALALAMLATLVALALEAPRPLATERSNQHVWLQTTGWAVVAVATGYVAIQTTAKDWIVLSAFVAVVVTAATAGRLALALGAAAATFVLTTGLLTDSPFGGTPLGGAVPASGKKMEVATNQVLRQSGNAEVVYLRKNQELQLRLDGEVVAAAGPDRSEEPLLAAILHAAVYDGDRVLLLGSGTGRVEASLRSTQRCEIESAAAWPELVALQATVLVDGPVLRPGDNDPALGAPWSRGLCDLPNGSRQVVVLGELPSSPTAHRATASFQRQLRRVVGDGLVCQPIALDRVSGSLLESWFEAASGAHPWNGIYAVGNAAVLVSGVQRPSWRGGFSAWADEARWAMHAAHLGGPQDLDFAFLGALQPSAVAGSADKPVRDVARQLMRWLTIPVVLPSDLEPSALAATRTGPLLLRRWQRHQSEVSRAKGRLLALANTAAGRRDAQAIAARFLPMGAPAPWLQAALGLAGPDGIALRDAPLASRCAFAIDPTFFQSPAPVFATLPLPNQKRGDLEDLHRLDDGEQLVQRCSGDGPKAVSVRVRFPSRCARSLVAALHKGTLADDPALALRELADPFVLAEAARVLVPAGRWRELLMFWRADLPCPKALVEISAHAGFEDRLALALALRGRRETSCYPVIARFLCAEELELRKVAGEALRMAVGERIAFDAHWPRSRRLDAASRLRVLHNRKP